VAHGYFCMYLGCHSSGGLVHVVGSAQAAGFGAVRRVWSSLPNVKVVSADPQSIARALPPANVYGAAIDVPPYRALIHSDDNVHTVSAHRRRRERLAMIEEVQTASESLRRVVLEPPTGA